MNAQLPGIPERLEHLRFLGQVGVVAVLDIALADEGLEVGAVLDAVRRVDVDHLHPAGHALLLEQAGHHQQAVAGDQAVGPVALMAVEVDGLAAGQVGGGVLEQAGLDGQGGLFALGLLIHALAHRPEDGGGVDAFVDVQADGVDLETGPLRLAGPVEVRGLQALEFLQGLAHLNEIVGFQGVVDQALDGAALGVEVQSRVQVGVVGPALLATFRVGGGVD